MAHLPPVGTIISIPKGAVLARGTFGDLSGRLVFNQASASWHLASHSRGPVVIIENSRDQEDLGNAKRLELTRVSANLAFARVLH